jgi:hypothetical protein
LKSQRVEQGQAVVFADYCLHSGGENEAGQWVYRAFFYAFLADPVDVPASSLGDQIPLLGEQQGPRCLLNKRCQYGSTESGLDYSRMRHRKR